MKIRYSPRATSDLELIHEYLAKRNPQGAVKVMTAIFAAIEFIRRFPDAAETTRIPDVRGKLVQRYRFKIFYRVLTSEDLIEIVHVRHTSRRPWGEEQDSE
jgi:addiction module RelE/StbE family toxin